MSICFKYVYVGLIGFGFTGRYSTYSIIDKDIKDMYVYMYCVV